MPVTTTEMVATNCSVWLDNAANVLVDISASALSLEYSPENGIAEWRPFSAQWKSRRVVGKDAPIKIKAVYTTNGAEVAQLVENWFFGGNDDSRSIQWYQPDKGVGAYIYYGEVVLASQPVVLDSEADEVVYIEIELLPDGAINRAINAT